ncbi:MULTISPECIES: phosphoenolpyruvate--protein phosphotransferase [Thalassospira]|uniref:Phosphoenolpyruvate-protein phosphotransferase n=2 Tax=Thalassospira TaxID=168934 RepID=A0A367WEM4_9PROT|nr:MULTISPECIES: phosphoenolpyruvate--protein phosphotransferase [Thalassospira]MDG4718901.1 phosphoenolpyruvate--protein phosphotransferase [Thalassospira sp. FZY0004]RCK39868.1 phosphoenolpyruvate-protein phosphotransferase [Thalassospira profundimaris]
MQVPPKDQTIPEDHSTGVRRVITGLGASGGIVIGRAFVLDRQYIQVSRKPIAEDAVQAECKRLHDGVSESIDQLKRLKSQSSTADSAASEELGFLLDAYIHMLTQSRLVRGAEELIVSRKLNAVHAVSEVIDAIATQFSGMDDRYIAARATDIREVGLRLMRCLMGETDRAVDKAPKGSILIAEDVSPADMARFEPGQLTAFVTALGGAEGHTAIMARSLGIPAVLGAADIIRGVSGGDQIIVDGGRGEVILSPSEADIAHYSQRRTDWLAARDKLASLRDVPSATRDGVDIDLHANIELPIELSAALENGATGIGLLRSEFMFMNKDYLPDEDEQYEELADIVKRMGGKPVTIRTLDIGGEKLAVALQNEMGSGPNPALGLRGIRLSLRKSELLEAQFAAILRASLHGPIRVLIPMVVGVHEMTRARQIYEAVARRLRKDGHAIPETLPPLGAMIEIPAAAIAIDTLSRECDFFAIGTNDLTQYTLAIDRTDDQVAGLYDPLNPAVLRLIRDVIRVAGERDIPVSVCGEMAGDPRYVPLFIGFGLRNLSMSPVNLLPVKQRLRRLDTRNSEHQASRVMEQWDSARIAMMLDDFNDLA